MPIIDSAENETPSLPPLLSWVVLGGLLFIWMLSAERAIAESFYPQFQSLTAFPGVILIATIGTLFALALVFQLLKRPIAKGKSDRPISPPPLLLLSFTPTLFNLIYLLQGNFDQLSSRLLLWFSTWLVLVLILRNFAHFKHWTNWLWLLLLLIFPLYWATLGRDVGSADTFEFQVSAPTLGIAHPTGYPLYLLLGKIWTMLPFVSSIAMRLNIGTMIYALLTVGLMWGLQTHLFDQPVLNLVSISLFGLLPTYWSQTVSAEIYTLHSLIVVSILLLCHAILRLDQLGKPGTRDYKSLSPLGNKLYLGLFFLLGLGLTNHLTTLLLFPAIFVTLLLTKARKPWQYGWRFLLACLGAFLLPLLLYTYLPLRWRAVNGEAMGFGRFFAWVTGSRFAGALQFDAWLTDSTRWQIIGRLFLQEWDWIGLVAVAFGAIALLIHNRRFALILLLTWASFTFYCLNYYVPDLNVFLLPAHLTMTFALAAGPAFIVLWLRENKSRPALANVVSTGFILLIAGIGFYRATSTYRQVDASAENPLVNWGRSTLALPLDDGAIILADSDKFPPLYYLQQVEHLRPDLTISVLPDEAAYRAEIGRIAALPVDNRPTIYLARYLPNLTGRSEAVGPLVDFNPTKTYSESSTPAAAMLDFGSFHLVDWQLGSANDYLSDKISLSLTWQVAQQPDIPLQIYTRWRPGASTEQVNSFAPIHGYSNSVTWPRNAIINDFYLLEMPPNGHYQLELAVAPAFSPTDQLDWQTLTSAEFSHAQQAKPACIWLTALLPCQLDPSPANIPIPATASNLDNKVALLAIDTPTNQLVPGSIYQFSLKWLSLSEMDEDYTVFTQILDANDKIVAQVDSWPVQGTYPTSQWQLGEEIDDPYALQLSAELPAGHYRLIVGMYLLGDLRRLPLLDANSQPIDDKISIDNLFVP